MIAELRALGWQVDVIDLGEDFRVRTRRAKPAAREKLLPTSPNGCPIVIDGLAFGVLPEAAQRAARAQSADRTGASSAGAGNGSFAGRRGGVAQERTRTRWPPRAASIVDQPVDRATSDRRLRRAARAHHRGAARHRSRRRAPTGSSDGIVRLLAVGSVVPRKGYDVLIAALAPLADLPWRLTIAGDRTRDPRRPPRSSKPTSRATSLADRIDVARRGAGGSSRRALRRRRSVRAGRRASRATAWPTPRRWRTACR